MEEEYIFFDYGSYLSAQNARKYGNYLLSPESTSRRLHSRANRKPLDGMNTTVSRTAAGSPGRAQIVSNSMNLFRSSPEPYQIVPVALELIKTLECRFPLSSSLYLVVVGWSHLAYIIKVIYKYHTIKACCFIYKKWQIIFGQGPCRTVVDQVVQAS